MEEPESKHLTLIHAYEILSKNEVSPHFSKSAEVKNLRERVYVCVHAHVRVCNMVSLCCPGAPQVQDPSALAI